MICQKKLILTKIFKLTFQETKKLLLLGKRKELYSMRERERG